MVTKDFIFQNTCRELLFRHSGFSKKFNKNEIASDPEILLDRKSGKHYNFLTLLIFVR